MRNAWLARISYKVEERRLSTRPLDLINYYLTGFWGFGEQYVNVILVQLRIAHP